MIPRYRILHERIESEWVELEHAAEKAVQASEEAKRNDQQKSFFLDSVAINLHSFYNGVERIFEWIARELDGGLPAGPVWHRELILSKKVMLVWPAALVPEDGDQSRQDLPRQN